MVIEGTTEETTEGIIEGLIEEIIEGVTEGTMEVAVDKIDAITTVMVVAAAVYKVKNDATSKSRSAEAVLKILIRFLIF